MTSTDQDDQAKRQIDELLAQRRAKLNQWRTQGNAYPNDFIPDATSFELHAEYDEKPDAWLEQQAIEVRIAGRLMTKRVMGKASFATLQDAAGRMQIHLRRDELPELIYQEFKHFDAGDLIGAIGTLFKTKTGELTVRVRVVRLLAKALRPLPEKYHGLTDSQIRSRRRYLDLISNAASRKIFRTRSEMINQIRCFLNQRGFVEVETPMMHPIPGGAAARPFITHHNTLDMDLYLRIAPELYLKRLIVGGMERVFELNRSFRNEGMSTRHNPEFTMLEFYQAYATYEDLMALTEEMFRLLCQSIHDGSVITYQGQQLDFSAPFERLSIEQALLQYHPTLDAQNLRQPDYLEKWASERNIALPSPLTAGQGLMELFEKTIEHQLRGPVFITGFPTEVSPLARRHPDDPFLSERFELFIAGREIANGFSELNDPEDQAQRFREQLARREAGDEEAMAFDSDYIEALEYGMPPTAGEGIGIDRLAMLLTDSASIRDVILFPLLRPDERY